MKGSVNQELVNHLQKKGKERDFCYQALSKKTYLLRNKSLKCMLLVKIVKIIIKV